MEDNQPPILEDDVFSSTVAPYQQKSPSRLHFSAMDAIPSRPRPLHPTPMRRGSPLNPQNIHQTSEMRRRLAPSDTVFSLPDTPPKTRRVTSGSMTGSTDDPDTELEVGVFSNEYDLAHEDPRILQDVQRALQLKTRREARLKRQDVATRGTTAFSSHGSSSSSPPPKLLLHPRMSPASSVSASPNLKSSNSTTSEVDFSPSTGIHDVPTKLHPVPTSLDNCITLDWTATSSHEGEKRWTKSIVKKKEKDTLPPLEVMINEQEQMHKEKLARMSNLASAQTNQKAHITSEQLGRRYHLLYESFRSKKPFNLAKVKRWYSSQPEVARRSLERTEPFTWLRHLEKRSGRLTRSHWNLTALIIEEYVQTQEHNLRMETIPEDTTLSSPTIPYRRNSRSPSFFPPPKPIPDDRISFEPLAESKRNSWDAISLKSAESALGTSVPQQMPVATSRPDDGTKNTKSTPSFFLERARSPVITLSDTEDVWLNAPKLPVKTSMVPELSEPPSTHTDTAKTAPGPITVTASTGSSGSSGAKPLVSPTSQSLISLGPPSKPEQHTKGRHPTRRGKKYKEQRERQLRHEYDAKALLLAEAVRHNSKIRHLLNRISTSMKDYHSLQSVIPENIRVMLPDVPKELIEAFGHDPAGVTGSTRRMQGWRAVEDIHNRVHRQRQIFKSFIDSFEPVLPTDECPLDQPIEILEGLLEALQNQKEEIVADAETVSELLNVVQEKHGKVKDEYNKTISHVSVVYPQLSHIVALEESYKDQYQQFWELGMDALTLLLDTVTPFWRQYGKTIGKDVRDFLIIPLYRNEFTGEPKRYRIEELPRRPLRHWFWLSVFFLCSISINILQVRAAISSTINFRLALIPYNGIRWTALPFFWISIIIQWFAVLFEFAIVFMELGVIAWWTGWTVNFVS